jgi:hypothetical protein
MAIRLTESRLRQIIREEATALTRRSRARRTNESYHMTLPEQMDDAIAMANIPAPALRRYRRQLGDGLDDRQLANGLYQLMTRYGNVGPDLQALGDRVEAGDERAVQEFCDAARQTVELSEG